MNPESLDWWADKLAVITAVLTLMAASAGVFAYLFAAWSSKAKDTALEKYKVDAGVAISQANSIAEVAKADAANAYLEMERLKATHADRTITDKQRVIFIAAVKNITKHGAQILCTRHGPEAVAYSEDFDKLLTDAGFTVTNNRGTILQGLNGLLVSVNNPDSSNAKVILEAFASVGIKAEGKSMPGIPDCDISVMVGYKPLEAITDGQNSSQQPNNKSQ